MSTTEDPPTFEAALVGLERIVDGLERGDLDLAAALADYQKGVALLARCQSLLDGVDRSVALLTGVEPDGTPITVAFDATATAPIEPARPAPKASKPRKPKSVDLGDLDFDPPF